MVNFGEKNERNKKRDPFLFLNFIKEIAIYLCSSKIENEEKPNEFEEIIQKLEAEIRQHIAVFILKSFEFFIKINI